MILIKLVVLVFSVSSVTRCRKVMVEVNFNVVAIALELTHAIVSDKPPELSSNP